ACFGYASTGTVRRMLRRLRSGGRESFSPGSNAQLLSQRQRSWVQLALQPRRPPFLLRCEWTGENARLSRGCRLHATHQHQQRRRLPGLQLRIKTKGEVDFVELQYVYGDQLQLARFGHEPLQRNQWTRELPTQHLHGLRRQCRLRADLRRRVRAQAYRFTRWRILWPA